MNLPRSLVMYEDQGSDDFGSQVVLSVMRPRWSVFGDTRTNLGLGARGIFFLALFALS